MIFKATAMEHEPLQHGPDGLLPRKRQGQHVIVVSILLLLLFPRKRQGQQMTTTIITAKS